MDQKKKTWRWQKDELYNETKVPYKKYHKISILQVLVVLRI